MDVFLPLENNSPVCIVSAITPFPQLQDPADRQYPLKLSWPSQILSQRPAASSLLNPISSLCAYQIAPLFFLHSISYVQLTL